MEDTLVWLSEKSGCYSTKSGYALTKLAGENRAHHQNTAQFSWKASIWNIDTSPKLKLFLWKLANRALPVGEALARRGIAATTTCKRCGAIESEIHTFFQCPFAEKVWDLIPALHKPISSTSNILNLIDISKKMITLPPAGITKPLFPWLLWNLWTCRNQLLFEDKKFSEVEVLNKSIRDAREWSNAQAIPVSNPPAPPPPSALNYSSTATACFTDGAWDNVTKTGGMGWCFHDHLGSVTLQGADAKRYVGSALMAETLALKMALTTAVRNDILDLRCFSDSRSLVSLLTTNTSVVELQGILHDIRVLSSSLNSISFHYISRLENGFADGLAKSALALCMNSPPSME